MGPPAVIVNGSARGKPARATRRDRPDDRGEPEGGLEHGEVVADARARAGAERQVLPAVACLRCARAEPVGVEALGVVPQRRVAVQGVAADHDVGARPGPGTRRRRRRASRAGRRPAPAGTGAAPRAGPGRCRGAAGRRRRSAGGRRAPRPRRRPGPASLVAAERPQRVGQRRRGGVVPGDQEDDELVADLSRVESGPPVTGSPARCRSRISSASCAGPASSIASSITVHGRERLPHPPSGRGRQPQRRPDRTKRPLGVPREQPPDRRARAPRPGRPGRARGPSAEHLQRQPPHRCVQVDRRRDRRVSSRRSPRPAMCPA